MVPPTSVHASRPRIEGDRETEVLAAALQLLIRVGYDRMTMDAVAAEAKAGKATLYRRWSSKSALVVDAVLHSKEALQVPQADTGNLRDDLLATMCGHGGLSDDRSAQVMAAVVTAIHVDAEFAEEFRARVVAPKMIAGREVFERAQRRGEISPDLDLDLISSALPAIVLHRSFVLGLPADDAIVTRVLDEIVLPAALRHPSPDSKRKQTS